MILPGSLTVGVDVGGTKIAAGVVDGAGRILARTRKPTPATQTDAIADAIAACVEEIAGAVGGTAGRPVSVGIGAAGFVDARRATVLFAPNLSWRDAPLAASVAARTGLPTVVENDANAAAWGEFRFGGGHDVDDMVLVTVGTGIGGGVVMGGRLIRGAYGVAAEIGHLRVVPGGHRCGCGNRGCWEQYASGNALVREARELVKSSSPVAERLRALCGGDADLLSGPMVTGAAAAGDAAAGELIQELGQWLGEGIASLVAVLDPAVVVIGGGVSAAGDLLVDPTRAAFRRQLTGRGYRPEATIRIAVLGNDAGIVGAADLARQP
jgi:glucokinase